MEQDADFRMKSDPRHSRRISVIEVQREGISRIHMPQAQLREVQRQAAQPLWAVAAPAVLLLPLLAPQPLSKPPLAG